MGFNTEGGIGSLVMTTVMNGEQGVQCGLQSKGKWFQLRENYKREGIRLIYGLRIPFHDIRRYYLFRYRFLCVDGVLNEAAESNVLIGFHPITGVKANVVLTVQM